MPYTYAYPRPAVTVDCVLFGYDGADLRILLIERAHEPFEGRWALPGGFVDMDEDLDRAALRELEEETGVPSVPVEQVRAFGAVDRDPRGRTIGVAYSALVPMGAHRPRAASDARSVAWKSTRDLPPLAFDHDAVVAAALDRLQERARYRPLGLEVLPRKFPLDQLRRLCELALRRPLDRRRFRRRMLASGLVVELDETRRGAGRSVRLYRFDRRRYRALSRQGFDSAL